MKHERDIGQRWRLKRTLKRRTEFRPIEDEDCRYIWAAYKKGALASMGGKFADTTMTPADFELAFVAEVAANFQGAWTLSAETARGFMPVGVVLAFLSHPNPNYAPFMIIGDI